MINLIITIIICVTIITVICVYFSFKNTFDEGLKNKKDITANKKGPFKYTEYCPACNMSASPGAKKLKSDGFFHSVCLFCRFKYYFVRLDDKETKTI